MSIYAIATVPTDWTPEIPLGFSEAGYQRWHKQIEPGTVLLIYKASPVNAIVAEGQLPDTVFQRVEDWPEANVQHTVKTAQGRPAAYILPISVNYAHDQSHFRSVELIDEIETGIEVPIRDEWVPIDADIYHLLLD